MHMFIYRRFNAYKQHYIHVTITEDLRSDIIIYNTDAPSIMRLIESMPIVSVNINSHVLSDHNGEYSYTEAQDLAKQLRANFPNLTILIDQRKFN